MVDLKDESQTRIAALAAELRELNGRMRRRLLEQADTGDLTSSQTAAMLQLEREGPMTVTALARSAGVRPQSMGATVAALEAKGFVTGAPDPQDGRQTLLSLTPHCRKMIRAGRAARQDWLARTIEARLSAPEQDKLAATLELIRRLVE